MNLRQYMAIKYRGGAQALLKKEADVFGIPYPLRSGWVGKYGDMDITLAMVQRLRSFLGNSEKGSAKRALQALNEEYVDKPSNMLEQLIIEARANPGKLQELAQLIKAV